MFERVYLGPAAEAEHARAAGAIARIFDYLLEHPDEVPAEGTGDEVERVTDYVAGMTDRFALAYAARI
jgi:dGTPase